VPTAGTLCYSILPAPSETTCVLGKVHLVKKYCVEHRYPNICSSEACMVATTLCHLGVLQLYPHGSCNISGLLYMDRFPLFNPSQLPNMGNSLRHAWICLLCEHTPVPPCAPCNVGFAAVDGRLHPSPLGTQIFPFLPLSTGHGHSCQCTTEQP